MSSRRSRFSFQRLLCSLAAVAVGIFASVGADKQFNCPNGGEPKADDNGVSVQCLPGQSSDSVCGRGYSCYFSGFNYQCCPTADEDYDDAHDACPYGTAALLDEAGKPIPCSQFKKCSKTAFCYGSTSVCCEAKASPKLTTITAAGVDVDITDKPQILELETEKKIEKDELKLTSAEQAGAVDIASLECPKHTLTILNGDGLPLECSGEKQCPQQNMFCHNVAGHSICCEGSGTARAELDDEDGPKNPLKYRPEEADKVKETLKVLEEIEKAVLTAKPEQSTEPPASADESTAPASVTDDTVQATEGKRHYADSDNDALPAAGGPETTATESTQPSRQYADNEGAFFTVEKQTTKRPKQRKIKDSQVTGPAKAQAAKLHPQEAGPPAATYDGIEYRPHALGGYAVSKKLHGTNLKAPRPEKKALVQQFLLDQIKDGWPYDEKFYRPENIAILRKGSRPSAVVHFPN